MFQMRRTEDEGLEMVVAPRGADDELRSSEHPEQVLRFVARFDRGDYWLAHEELEDLWLEDRDDLYKGLIQVAAAFVHVDRNNWNGAAKLLSSGLGLLADYPEQERGFDLDQIRAAASEALDHVQDLRRTGKRQFDESLRFRLSPHFAGEVRADLVEDVDLPYRVRRHDQGDKG